MKSSCRASLHRELLNSTSSTFYQVKRISGMHLKPYLKLQKKERPLEISPDPPQSPPMSQQKLVKEENRSGPKAGLLASPSLRKPLGSLSANALCGRNGGRVQAEGLSGKEKRGILPATIHQGDDGEGLLDIWAVVKPGNTKEKIAFFAARQCSDSRAASMKNKSTWDIDGRATKRRKKSLDLRRAHLERPREAGGRCHPPELFACSIGHCSVHNVNDGVEGGFPGRPLSVIEMVAFLEHRTSDLLTDCTKNWPSSPAVARFLGPPKAALLASGPFPASGGSEARSEKATCRDGGDGEPPAEPLRVLDMVAKLESECLRQQSEREAGSLSRNNSFRRNVGRVLLASGTPVESEAGKEPSGVLSQEERAREEGGWRSECGSSVEGGFWEVSQSSSFVAALEESSGSKCYLGTSAPPGSWREAKKSTASLPSKYPEPAQACPCSFHGGKNAAIDCTSKESGAAPHLSSNLRTPESLSVSISVTETDKARRKAHPSHSSFGEDSLPGRLFLLFSERETHDKHLHTGGATTLEERQPDVHGEEDPSAHTPCRRRNSVSGEPPDSPPESTLQALDSCHLKRQRSHDFLETRFKIQQLLEPQQYLAFLPHHVLVKIFAMLPTRSLVALKCTCGYFKFVIEYYNIRPADSRWVRDPRYREDPCKQCKKKYVRGDVSLCRWHPKPYCQALPYGPGYWMCCHRSQKNVPGCKLGLHDNHWVPACHSFNRALHKKSRETEEDC